MSSPERPDPVASATTPVGYDVSVYTAFWVEQGFWILLNIVYLILFILQFLTERRYKLDTASLKYKFHRTGVVATIIQLVLSIDPYGIHGIYSPITGTWLSANCTVVIIACLVIAKSTLVYIYFAGQFKNTPLWVMFEEYAVLTTLVGMCNVSYGLAYERNKWWYTGMFILTVGVIIIVEACIFAGLSIWLVRRLEEAAKEQHHKKAATQRKKRRQMYAKAIVVMFVTLCLLPWQFYDAISVLSNHTATSPYINLNTFDWTDRIFTYLQWVAIGIILWYSWLPLEGHTYSKVSTEDQDREPNQFKRRSSISTLGTSDTSTNLSLSNSEEVSSKTGSWKQASKKRITDSDLSMPRTLDNVFAV